MADGEVNSNPQPGANGQPSAASPSTDNPQNSVNTPSGENPGSESTAPQAVPYPRFKEVIDYKNQVESQLEELRNRLAAQESSRAQAKKTDAHQKYVQKLTSAGMSPEVAQLLTEVFGESARDIVSEHVAPLQQETAATRVDQWVNKLASTHKDWYELEPAMEKILNGMPKGMQSAFISSPEGLEMLYSKAKLAKVMESGQQLVNKGAEQAYQNKGVKVAMSPTPGASVPKSNVLSASDLMSMPNAEFEKRQRELVEMVKRGELK